VTGESISADDSEDRPRRHQRVAAYAVLTRNPGDGSVELLLTRISARGHHPGAWTLPGGGVDHGEPPRAAVLRELREETGLAIVVGDLLDVHDSHFTGRAPDRVIEDYHGIHLIFGARLLEPPDGRGPTVVEADGTTDAVAWIPVADLRAGRIELLDLVRFTIEHCLPRPRQAESDRSAGPSPAGTAGSAGR
jgi:8-oxo-dGTP diphosphatase